MTLGADLAQLTHVRHGDDGWLVTTTCMLPSGQLVAVHVRGGPTRCVVTDDGLAISEMEAAGVDVTWADALLRRHAHRFGVVAKNGEIFVSVPVDEARAAVVLVANAAAVAVEEEVARARITPVRDLRKALDDVLKVTIPSDFEARRERITGKHAVHDFDHVLARISGNRRIIVDAVLPEASSINARIVAHLDVREEHGDRIGRMMVFDDQQHWTTDKLGLMKMAADLVPLSQLPNVIHSRLVRLT